LRGLKVFRVRQKPSQHFRTPAWCRIVRHREESHGEREI
jgi:hypothetical protein